MAFQFKANRKQLNAFIKKLEKIEFLVDEDIADKIGKEVVTEMKSLISTGTSPIRKNGRFPRYKNPKKYPGKRKDHSPVNLKLTGKFLDSLTSTVTKRQGRNQSVVFLEGKKSELKEKGHREGAKGQPSRPIIPEVALGEEFAQRIQNKINRLLDLAIKRFIQS